MSFRSIKEVFTEEEIELIAGRIYRRVCLSGFVGTKMQDLVEMQFTSEEYERAYKEFNK